jgi:hypothetical protein
MFEAAFTFDKDSILRESRSQLQSEPATTQDGTEGLSGEDVCRLTDTEGEDNSSTSSLFDNSEAFHVQIDVNYLDKFDPEKQIALEHNDGSVG